MVVNHFTMANILAAQVLPTILCCYLLLLMAPPRPLTEAAGYYEVVLYHQPEFGPAADTVRCMIVLGEHKLKQQQIGLQDKPRGGTTS